MGFVSWFNWNYFIRNESMLKSMTKWTKRIKSDLLNVLTQHKLKIAQRNICACSIRYVITRWQYHTIPLRSRIACKVVRPRLAGHDWNNVMNNTQFHLWLLGSFQKPYVVTNLRAFKISTLHENFIFQFIIPHKTPHIYNERCVFYWQVKFWEFLDLRADYYFWNAPVATTSHSICTLFVVSLRLYDRFLMSLCEQFKRALPV